MKEITKNYLKKGTYLSINNRLFLKVTAHNIAFYIKDIVWGILKRKIYILNINEHNLSILSGDIAISRAFDNQVIVIDNPNWVYRVYTDNDQFRKVKDGHKFLETIYKINPIIVASDNITKEKFIQGKTLTKASEKKQNQVFDDIIERFEKNLAKNAIKSLSPRIDFENFSLKAKETVYPQEMMDLFFLRTDTSRKIFEGYQWYYNHGDLTPGNILFNKGGYYIVDGERCENLPLFYDIANLMNTYVLMTENSYPYKQYFSGKYDEVLKKITNLTYINANVRELIIIQMLILKATIVWDADVKGRDKSLMQKRWNAVSSFIV